MRKSYLFLVITIFLASIATMLELHWRQGAELNSRLHQAETLGLRQESAQRLIFELEQYKTVNANFRRMYNEDIRAAKDRIAESFRTITSELDQGPQGFAGPQTIDDEHAKIAQIRAQFSAMQTLGAKLEPQLYSRNVYQNADIQQTHSEIIKGLQEISRNARRGAEQARTAITSSLGSSKKLFADAAAASCAALLLLIGYGYLMHSRPLRRLQKRIARIRAGLEPDPKKRPLRGIYGEIEQLVRDFLATIAGHRRERLDFVTAVATDLKGPLHSVRGAAEVFAMSDEKLLSDPRFRIAAVEATRSALHRLGAVLDGLNDILDSGEGELKLEEQITDLGQLLNQTARVMKSEKREVNVLMPALPVWARLDRDRFEHLLVYLGSRFIDHEGASRLILEVTRGEVPANGNGKGGLQIAFYEGAENGAPAGLKTRRPGTSIPSSGPDQDLLKHWATQRGFGMSMADRIMRAHGGTVTAAGVAGSKLVFKIWLPAERISMGVVSKNLTTLDLALAEAEQQPALQGPPSVHPRN